MITSEEYQQLQERIARNQAESIRRRLGFDPTTLINQLSAAMAPVEKHMAVIEAHRQLALAAGLKPRKERSPAEQRAYQTACMQRYRNEQRGKPTNHLPPRMRKPYTKRKEQ